jgi:hypothetical protein
MTHLDLLDGRLKGERMDGDESKAHGGTPGDAGGMDEPHSTETLEAAVS